MTATMYNLSMAKKKSTDRHLSKFVVRLPDVFRTRIEEFQKRYYTEHGIRPSYTACIKLALNSLFESNGVKPVDLSEDK